MPASAEDLRHAAARLALAGAGAHGADGDARLPRDKLGLPRRDEPEVGSRRERARGDVHHVLVRDVRVREHDLVRCVLGDDLLELGLGPDRDAHRIPVPGELVRVDAPLDVRDLGGREGDDLVLGGVAEEDVEVVEVAAGGADYHHARGSIGGEHMQRGRTERARLRPCVPKPCTHGAEKSPSPTRCSGAGRSTSSTCPASSRTSSSGGTCRPSLAGSSSSAPSLGSYCSTSAEPACRTASPGRRRSRRGWTTCALSWMQSARAARPCSASRKAHP